MLYEIVIMTKQDLSPKALSELIDGYKTLVTKEGGKVVGTEDWGLKALAYKIKKHSHAYYSFLKLESEYPPVSKFESEIRVDEDVLRYLIVKVEKFSDSPSPISVQKGKST